MMEPTFYEESSRFIGIGGGVRAVNKSVMHGGELGPRAGTKRPMTLDLDSTKHSTKKQKMSATMLTSPDLNMLKLGSPELERLIIAHHGANMGNVTTATPTPTQCMYPSAAKNNDMDRDFVEALGNLHQHPANTSANQHMYQQQGIVVPISESQCPPSTCMENDNYYQHNHHQNSMIPSTSATAFMNSNNPHLPVSNGYHHFNSIPPQVCIKEEPQTVPCMGMTPPLSPINMENQERIKLERKRLRNRIAASKCRKRKLERIARLEEKVAILKGENLDLTNSVNTLREQVCSLKQQVIDHLQSGCEFPNFRPDFAQF